MSRRKTALICGVGGQDGAFLARSLLGKGYSVFGTSRDAQGNTFENLMRLHISDRVQLLSMNSQDFRSVLMALETSNADEVYFLSGQSSVGLSFVEPADTIESIVLGTLNMLEACRMLKREIRQYHAGTIECYGDTNGRVVSEADTFNPTSPYGVAKVSAYWLVNNYRQAYNLYATVGIMSNHESPLRPLRYVTQKIIQGSKRIASGDQMELELGRLDIHRDWGWAAEFVEAMWLSLQQPESDNYLIATGETYSLLQFVEAAFDFVGLDWRDHVTQAQHLLRPTDIRRSYANPAKAARVLKWEAETAMPKVVERMMAADLT